MTIHVKVNETRFGSGLRIKLIDCLSQTSTETIPFFHLRPLINRFDKPQSKSPSNSNGMRFFQTKVLQRRPETSKGMSDYNRNNEGCYW